MSNDDDRHNAPIPQYSAKVRVPDKYYPVAVGVQCQFITGPCTKYCLKGKWSVIYASQSLLTSLSPELVDGSVANQMSSSLSCRSHSTVRGGPSLDSVDVFLDESHPKS